MAQVNQNYYLKVSSELNKEVTKFFKSKKSL
jgi:hypothetical protein